MSQKALTESSEIRQVASIVSKYDGLLGFDTESSGPLLVGLTGSKTFINVFTSTLTGFSIHLADLGCSYYVPIAHRRGNANVADALLLLSTVLGKPRVVAHNAIHELSVMRTVDRQYGTSMFSLASKSLVCSQVAAWLACLSDAGYGLKHLASALFGYTPLTFQQVAGPNAQFADLIPAGQAVQYACDDAELAVKVYRKAMQRLSDWNLERLFFDTENRFLRVLEHMHWNGVPVDREALSSLRDKLMVEANRLHDTWDFLTDGVNINSPAQVARWGYDGPGCWPRHVSTAGKAGHLSVNRVTLQAVVASMEPDTVGWQAAKTKLDFQEIFKLASTYTDSLIEKAAQYPDHRLHPSFSQTGTATGRLSCSYPNLQNIPARSALGKAVRSVFRAEDGRVFVSADYSQIELRVLAHLVGGRGALADAYVNNVDIHQRTADSVGTSRQIAKTVNFLIVYGGGPKKLSDATGMPYEDAKRVIDAYKATYPEVVRFRDRAVEFARRNGYVHTIFRRRRYLPGIGTDGPDAWRAERLAVNTPVQGGARDVMTAGMLKFWDIASDAIRSGDIRIVNQIHDDLMLEVTDRPDVIDYAKQCLRTAMETAITMRVPLKVEPVSGKTWADLKDG